MFPTIAKAGLIFIVGHLAFIVWLCFFLAAADASLVPDSSPPAAGRPVQGIVGLARSAMAVSSRSSSGPSGHPSGVSGPLD